jgi:hypothetical protein
VRAEATDALRVLATAAALQRSTCDRSMSSRRQTQATHQ